MNLEDLALGWREALLAVVACLVLYVIFAVFRLRRLRRPPAVAASADLNTAVEQTETVVAPRPAVREELPFPWYEPPDDVPLPSQDTVGHAVDGALLSRLEAAERSIAEFTRLRDEVVIMRSELAAVRAEVARQLERLRATQHVAPIYGDAMQMAAAGYDAAAIAERCGVARAEADLVVALMRSQGGKETMREK